MAAVRNSPPADRTLALIKNAHMKLRAEALLKKAFTPIDPAAGGGAPPGGDPAAGGGAPPGSAPPPGAGGDPAAGGGAPPPGGAGDPSAGGPVIQMNASDLQQLMQQMMQQMMQGGGQPGGQPGAPGAGGSKKNQTDIMLQTISDKLDELIGAIMGMMQPGGDPTGGGGEPPPSMGAGTPGAVPDPSAGGMPPPEAGGMPPPPAPGPPGGMQVQASAKMAAVAPNPKVLALLTQLRRPRK